MRIGLLVGFFLIAHQLAAQNVTIRKVELAGNKVIITYDLDDSNSSNEYKLDLYASKDNFAAPLTKVTGDIGQEIKPGLGKKVEWSVVDEFGGYKGRMSLEIRGKVFIPFAKFKNFDAERSYKRGKQYDILWKAGNNNPVNVELYKGNQRVQGEMNHANNGNYTIFIPSDAKPGKDYRIKITDSKNTDDAIYSGVFKVTPKVATGVKVLGALVIVGGGAFLATSGGSPTDGGGNNNANGPIELPDLP